MAQKTIKPSQHSESISKEIAIVGMACRFPKADNLEQYWSNIRRGVDAITRIPSDSHWDPNDYFDEDQSTPDMTYARRGGFINPVDFDVLDYGISPNNIEATDTTQLLGMVVAQEALKDAGYETGENAKDGRPFNRDRCSAIVGVTGTLELVIPLGARLGHPLWRQALREAGVDEQTANDVCQRISHSYIPWQENSFPGLLGNVAAGRIANRFDLGGSNCVVDAACASSLSAIHMAILELQTGRSDMAITGGLDTFNDIFMYMCFSKTPALSPTGNARPFDQQGDGTILGEGLGILILKRLEDAKHDGDRIYAVIESIGSSSDGRGNAIYAPSSQGQAKCLRDAYQEAGVTPDQIDLLEAHGTGTRVGDAVELSALNEVYRLDRKTQEVEGCETAIGSVKSMVGHTKAAAGAAGLIKAALALKNRTLPPTIKVSEPQSEVKPHESGIHVNHLARPILPRFTEASGSQKPARVPRAAMSAFGFGGSNYHCVLKAHTDQEAAEDLPPLTCDGSVIWLLASSQQHQVMADQLRQLLASLRQHTDQEAHPELKRNKLYDALRTQAFKWRQVFDGKQPIRLSMTFKRLDHTQVTAQAELNKVLDRIEDTLRQIEVLGQNKIELRELNPGTHLSTNLKTQNIAVLFPGQGSQYVNMLAELFCQSPIAQETLAALEAICPTGKYIYPPPAFEQETKQIQEATLRETHHAQPALGVTSIASWKILEAFGLKADRFAGHSFGEIPALCAAKVISPESALTMAADRGTAMMQAARQREADDQGSMLAVLCDKAQIQELIDLNDSLIIANENSPKQFILSGATAAIEQAEACLKAAKIRTKRLNVAAAFHSQFVSQAVKPFLSALEKQKFSKPANPVYCNTTAGLYSGTGKAMKQMLAQQLAEPVRYMDMIQQMINDGITTFIEVGPGQVLSSLVRKIAQQTDASDIHVLSQDHSQGEHLGAMYDMVNLLGQLSLLGQPIDLKQWDHNWQPSDQASSKKLTVRLTGANYVNPERKKSLPRRPKDLEQRESVEKVSATRIKENVNTPSQHQKSIEMSQPSSNPTHSVDPNQTHVNQAPLASEVSQAHSLALTQQSILAIQRLQEQTALLHKQYLDGQMASQQTLMHMLQQQQILLGQLPANAAIPVAMPIPTHTVPVTPAAQEPMGTVAPPVPPFITTPAHQQQASVQVQPTPAATTTAYTASTASLAPQTAPSPPVPAPISQPVETAAADSSKAENILLEVVAEKTGYPISMLELNMAMEADLGIDSIKRVEILSGMQDRMPDAPSVKPEDLGTLDTLQDVINYLADQTTATIRPNSQDQPTQPSQFASNAENILLEVVAEKTGYPTDMLGLDMALEADLGIDSIKRVEILSGMQDRMPDAPAVKPEDLGTLETLRDVINYLEGATSGKS